MLNPQTEIKFSDYNSLYDILNPTVNGFRDFSLSFLIDYKAGASLFSGTNYSLYSEGLHKGTLLGRTVDNAQDYHKGIVNNNIAEEFVYNASFIKLRELSLGYTFPQSVLNKMKVVKGLSVSLVGRNLWTILKHTDNIDPESAYNNTNGQGLELNGYPATRNIGFNVNVKF